MMYLLHRKEIDIYANICLFLFYSEVTVATQSSPYPAQIVTAVTRPSPYPDQMVDHQRNGVQENHQSVSGSSLFCRCRSIKELSFSLQNKVSNHRKWRLYSDHE